MKTKRSSIFSSFIFAFLFLFFSSAYTPFSNPVTVPAAEDVLVQQIPGDNQHMLMMANYSKENFSGDFVTLFVNSQGLVFKDDGKDYDKKKGDGLYTALVTANVNEFVRMAAEKYAAIKKAGDKPVYFNGRRIGESPDHVFGFDVQKFRANEPVSIADLTLDAGSPGGSKITKLRNNSVVVTDIGVVEDPARTWNPCEQKGNINGPWTFNTIMRQLASTSPTNIASDEQVSDFVKNLINNWSSEQVINGDTVTPRLKAESIILTPWFNKSEAAGAPAGQLDMRFAPFKLTAITNRFDLRAGERNGTTSNPAGEARFVFCLINPDCTAAMEMTLILEYGINVANTCQAKQTWAVQWYNLKDMAIGSSEYNSALQAITDQFSLCGNNPSKPNQSCLNQLRTNETVLAESLDTTEFREFVLDDATHLLKGHALGQTPANKYNAKLNNPDVARMAKYVNDNAKAIKDEVNTVPALFQDSFFLGGRSSITGPAVGLPPNVYYWDGGGVKGDAAFIRNNNARERFSINTCNGCHAGESQTNLTHIDPVFFGTQATLSGYLSGRAGRGGAIDFDNDPNNDEIAILDPALRPAGNPATVTFNDISRRAHDLKLFVETPCGSPLGISAALLFHPLNSVH